MVWLEFTTAQFNHRPSEEEEKNPGFSCRGEPALLEKAWKILNMTKWSDGHPRKNVKVKIVEGKVPHDCPTCKRARWFEQTENGNWVCPKCGSVLQFD